MPKVSIVMPAYNAAKYIAPTIESVLHQTYMDWELIIVDDESSDCTKDIVQSYCDMDERIKYIWQANGKQAKARNTAIGLASGQYIAFLDADDLWTKEKLQKQVSAFITHPDVDVVFTGGHIFFDDDLNTAIPYPTLHGKHSHWELYKLMYQCNHIANLSVMMKKEWAEKIGPQEENVLMQGSEDWDYWLRLVRNGAVFLGLEDKLFYYRRHSSNTSNNQLQMHIAEALVYTRNLEPKHLAKEIKHEKQYSFFIPLIEKLIQSRKLKEARYITKAWARVEPSLYKVLSYLIIKLFGSKAFLPYKILYKVNSKLMRYVS